MYIATLTLPNYANDGADLTDCHCALRATLCDTFGGFTATCADGGWRNGDAVQLERVTVYSIAMLATSDNAARLDSVALFYGHLARQHCVMVTHAAGDVVMVDCRAPRLVTA